MAIKSLHGSVVMLAYLAEVGKFYCSL